MSTLTVAITETGDDGVRTVTITPSDAASFDVSTSIGGHTVRISTDDRRPNEAPGQLITTDRISPAPKGATYFYTETESERIATTPVTVDGDRKVVRVKGSVKKPGSRWLPHSIGSSVRHAVISDIWAVRYGNTIYLRLSTAISPDLKQEPPAVTGSVDSYVCLNRGDARRFALALMKVATARLPTDEDDDDI